MKHMLAAACVLSVCVADSMSVDSLRVRDPFVVVDNGRYLLVSSTAETVGPETDEWGESRDEVTVRESTDLVRWSPPTTVLKLPKDFDSKALWAPELHRYRGDWYLFVAVNYREKKAGRGERGTWVFKGKSPMGPFRPHSKGSITPESWCALDGTLHVEDGHPYMVFCHEWIQVDPGTISAVRMTDDLSAAVGEPFTLHDAYLGEKASNVTDGPWLFKDKSGALQMLWSSGIRTNKWRYGVLQSTSRSGRLAGPWTDTKVVLDDDEGHGMLFTDLEGQLRMAFHGPNAMPRERLRTVPCEITEKGLRLADVIRPGVRWKDTEGRPIHAQGGTVMIHDGTYYWCGVDRSRTTGKDKVWHNGIVLYSSSGLTNWKREGTILPPDASDAKSVLHPHRQLDRCNLVYNERTKKFVCWVHMLDGGQTAATFVADEVTGPWKLAKRGVQPNGMECGDFSVNKDDDGRAYLYFNCPHVTLAVVELNDDYTDAKGPCTTFARTPGPPFTREAPTHFVRGGRHYLITSGTTHYYPNPSETLVSGGWTGPWTNLGDLAPGDASRTTFHAQICQVLKVPGKKDLYVAIADRWLPGRTDVGYPELEAAYKKAFGHAYDPKLAAVFDAKTGGEIYPDNAPICDACPVWLPLAFAADGRPILEWRDSWSPDDYQDGTVNQTGANKEATR